MQATLVGGSLHGTIIDVTDPQTPVRRLFRRDGLAWFECYEPATAHRAGDGELVMRFCVPPEDRASEDDRTLLAHREHAERRVHLERRATPRTEILNDLEISL